MQVSQEMLNAAMKKAVETGLLPKYADTDTYLKQWEAMRHCLQAAQDVAASEAMTAAQADPRYWR